MKLKRCSAGVRERGILLASGLMLTIAGVLLPQVMQTSSYLGPVGNDALEGAMFGASLGIYLVVAYLECRKRGEPER